MLIKKVPIDQALLALVEDGGLQVCDIGNGHHIDFFGISVDDKLQALIGIESLQRYALLRSLVVAKPLRARGYARKLVAHVERTAKDRGISELYLLTETATSFFEKIGYKHIARESSPTLIKNTKQFSSLCAKSCSLLHKEL